MRENPSPPSTATAFMPVVSLMRFTVDTWAPPPDWEESSMNRTSNPRDAADAIHAMGVSPFTGDSESPRSISSAYILLSAEPIIIRRVENELSGESTGDTEAS